MDDKLPGMQEEPRPDRAGGWPGLSRLSAWSTLLSGVALGVAVNFVSDLGGDTAAAARITGACAALAASLAAAQGLRQRDQRTRLVRLAGGVLLTLAVVAAVVAGAGPAAWSGYAMVGAACCVLVVVLSRTSPAAALTVLAGAAGTGVGIATMRVGGELYQAGHVVPGVAAALAAAPILRYNFAEVFSRLPVTDLTALLWLQSTGAAVLLFVWMPAVPRPADGFVAAGNGLVFIMMAVFRDLLHGSWRIGEESFRDLVERTFVTLTVWPGAAMVVLGSLDLLRSATGIGAAPWNVEVGLKSIVLGVLSIGLGVLHGPSRRLGLAATLAAFGAGLAGAGVVKEMAGEGWVAGAAAIAVGAALLGFAALILSESGLPQRLRTWLSEIPEEPSTTAAPAPAVSAPAAPASALAPGAAASAPAPAASAPAPGSAAPPAAAPAAAPPAAAPPAASTAAAPGAGAKPRPRRRKRRR